MSRSEVKGLSFYNVLESVRRLRGDEALERVRAVGPPEVIRLLDDRAMVVVGWYPLDWFQSLLAAALEATGGGLDFARDLGRDGTMQDFRGIYRLLRFVLAPEALLQRAQGVFDRYRRPGKLIVEEARPGYARVRLEGCVGFDAAMWQMTAGGCIGVLEVCGAKNVRPRVVAGAETGDAAATFEAHWE